jgi:hypothetical protein
VLNFFPHSKERTQTEVVPGVEEDIWNYDGEVAEG